jgi:phenylacetate-CoA ligase
VSAECEDAPGGSHVNRGHFPPEVVDPAGEEPVDGEGPGELVLTTLTKEGLPLTRYRTADITTLTEAPCPCGRTLRRMGPVLGPRDDMLILRGVNVYPSEIEQVLLEVDGVAPHWELRVERPDTMDEVTARCETEHHGADRDALAARLQAALRERTGSASPSSSSRPPICRAATARRSGSSTSERARAPAPSAASWSAATRRPAAGPVRRSGGRAASRSPCGA